MTHFGIHAEPTDVSDVYGVKHLWTEGDVLCLVDVVLGVLNVSPTHTCGEKLRLTGRRSEIGHSTHQSCLKRVEKLLVFYAVDIFSQTSCAFECECLFILLRDKQVKSS